MIHRITPGKVYGGKRRCGKMCWGMCGEVCLGCGERCGKFVGVGGRCGESGKVWRGVENVGEVCGSVFGVWRGVGNVFGCGNRC